MIHHITRDDWVSDVLGGIFHIIPPGVWILTGDMTYTLMALLVVTLFTLWATYRLVRRICIVTRFLTLGVTQAKSRPKNF